MRHKYFRLVAVAFHQRIHGNGKAAAVFAGLHGPRSEKPGRQRPFPGEHLHFHLVEARRRVGALGDTAHHSLKRLPGEGVEAHGCLVTLYEARPVAVGNAAPQDPLARLVAGKEEHGRSRRGQLPLIHELAKHDTRGGSKDLRAALVETGDLHGLLSNAEGGRCVVQLLLGGHTLGEKVLCPREVALCLVQAFLRLLHLRVDLGRVERREELSLPDLVAITNLQHAVDDSPVLEPQAYLLRVGADGARDDDVAREAPLRHRRHLHHHGVPWRIGRGGTWRTLGETGCTPRARPRPPLQEKESKP